MGAIKRRTKVRSAKSGKSAFSKIVSAGTSAVGALRSKSTQRTGVKKRSSRVTPEKLAKKILILRLQKRLYKMKYGGR